MATGAEYQESLTRAAIQQELDPRVLLAAAQLAILLGSADKVPDTIGMRIAELDVSQPCDPVDLLTEHEKRFLPAAKVVTGLVFDAAQDQAIQYSSAPRTNRWIKGGTMKRIAKGKEISRDKKGRPII